MNNQNSKTQEELIEKLTKENPNALEALKTIYGGGEASTAGYTIPKVTSWPESTFHDVLPPGTR